MTWQSAEIAGLAFGAIIGGVIGFSGACALNAASFLLSGLVILSMKVSFQEDADDKVRDRPRSRVVPSTRVSAAS